VADDITIPSTCPILGIPIEWKQGNGKASIANSPSLDRLDSTKGYTPDNVRVISYRANVIKNDGTAAEHRAIAAWMERESA